MKKHPMTKRGAEKLRKELQHLKSVDRPQDHPGDRRGARPRRPEGKRRVSRGP